MGHFRYIPHGTNGVGARKVEAEVTAMYAYSIISKLASASVKSFSFRAVYASMQ